MKNYSDLLDRCVRLQSVDSFQKLTKGAARYLDSWYTPIDGYQVCAVPVIRKISMVVGVMQCNAELFIGIRLVDKIKDTLHPDLSD